MMLDAGEQKNGVEGRQDTMKKHRHQVLFSGIVTAVGMPTLPICCSHVSSFMEMIGNYSWLINCIFDRFLARHNCLFD